MRLSGFNLNQLVCLEALLAECNVTRAANRVHLSQSAISAVLAQLRDHFGDELLVRSGRTMVLTPFAESLIAQLSQLLTQAQSFSGLRPGEETPEIDRELKLVASEYVVQTCLARGIGKATAEMPGLRFDILPLSDNSGKMIQKGEIDLLLAGQSLDVGTPPKAEVFSDKFVCLACAEFGPATGELTDESYIDADHVVVRYFAQQMVFDDEDALRRAGQSRRRRISVWSNLLVPQLVCGTKFIATVPQRVAERIAKRWPVRVHPFPFEHEPVRVFAYWHSSRDSDRVLARFLQYLS